MKKSPIAVAIASAFTFSFASFALAQGDPSAAPAPEASGKPMMSFDSLDTNKDQWVSNDEAAMHPDLSRQYNVADKDQDGYISQSEFSAFETEQGTASAGGAGMSEPVSFDSLDVNKDGSLTQDEVQSHPELSQQYTTADQDQDGMISQSEFSAFESKPAGQAGQQQSRSFDQLDSNKDGWLSKQEYETGMSGAMGAGSQAVSFQSLDVNKDGSISKSEANSDPTISQQFTSIDKDKNGTISQSEFSAFETSQVPRSSGSGGAAQ